MPITLRPASCFLRRHLAASALAVFASSTALLPAQTTLFSENFTGATVGSVSPNTKTVTNSTRVWRSTLDAGVSTVTLPTDSTTGPNEGSADKAMYVSPSSSATGYIAKFTATTLAVGDTLTLSFDYRFTIAPSTGTASGVRFGLYDSKGTDYTVPTADTYDNNDKGYRVYSAASSSSLAGSLSKEDGGDGSGNAGSAGGGSGDNTLLGSPTNFNQSTTTARYSFSITRDSATQVSFGLSINGTNRLSSSVTDSSSAIFTFDELLIGAGTATAYAFDNVTVVFTPSAVPEPSAYALLFSALAGAAVITTRRQRR